MPNDFAQTRLVLIPSFNTGPLLEKTVREALAHWRPVWVVIDGSSDGSDRLLEPLQAQFKDALKIIRLARNRGKGAALLAGIEAAAEHKFTHALTLDADYQHPAAAIRTFMQASLRQPESLILGAPVFDISAPAVRVYGRLVSNSLAKLETMSGAIQDSLFGMRLYPIADLRAVMASTRWARRFDFEPEVAVRLVWRGLPVINLPTPVRYWRAHEGGVSHFNYGRDNILLAWMHIRLLAGLLLRLPGLMAAKLKSPYSSHNDQP